MHRSDRSAQGWSVCYPDMPKSDINVQYISKKKWVPWSSLAGLPMTLSTSKKVAAARAKATMRKSSSTTSKKNKGTIKNSQSQVTLSSHSQMSRQVSVSEESVHNGGVINVDSDHIMESSDGEEGTTGSTKMSEDEEGDEGEEDEEAELCKSLPGLTNDKLNSE
jgi:hypothetical protein